MRYRKVEEIVEALMHKGFDMTTKEFFDVTVYRILKKYGIHEQLDLDEYFELLRRLMDFCAENDLKNVGLSSYVEDDWQDK